MVQTTEMLRSTQRLARKEKENGDDCEIGSLECRPQIAFLSGEEGRDLEETVVQPNNTISPASLTAIVLGSVIVCLGIVALIALIIVQRRKSKKQAPTKSRSLCVEEGIVYKDDTTASVDRNQSLETLPAPITPLKEFKQKKTKKHSDTKKTNKLTQNKQSPEKNDKAGTSYKDINFSPGQTSSGRKLFTAFTEAAFFGQLEQLETFADLCGTTVDGGFARLPSNRASAQALSQLMSEIDGEGYTALHRAIQGSSTVVLRWLLKNKADPRVLSRNGETPLHIAVLHQNIQACEILLATEASKDINTKDYRHGHTPLDIAKACEIGNIVELLKVASEML